MKITFIRHGTTAWNEESRYQGWTDLSLSAAGVREAHEAAEYFKQLHVNTVISSDLARCAETARIIFSAHTIRIMPELRELAFGAWEGLTYSECLARNPEEYSRWLDDPAAIVPPDGESLHEFERRVLRALDGLIREYDATSDCHLAIVTHGGPIRLALQHLLATDARPNEQNRLPPGGFVHVPIAATYTTLNIPE